MSELIVVLAAELILLSSVLAMSLQQKRHDVLSGRYFEQAPPAPGGIDGSWVSPLAPARLFGASSLIRTATAKAIKIAQQRYSFPPIPIQRPGRRIRRYARSQSLRAAASELPREAVRSPDPYLQWQALLREPERAFP